MIAVEIAVLAAVLAVGVTLVAWGHHTPKETQMQNPPAPLHGQFRAYTVAELHEALGRLVDDGHGQLSAVVSLDVEDRAVSAEVSLDLALWYGDDPEFEARALDDADAHPDAERVVLISPHHRH